MAKILPHYPDVGHIVTLVKREMRRLEIAKKHGMDEASWRYAHRHLLNILEILYHENLIYYCETMKELYRIVLNREEDLPTICP